MAKKLQLAFLATGDTKDLLNLPYNILGLHKNEIQDVKGDIVNVQYFVDYDDVTEVYDNLAVEEIRTYTRDVSTGVLKKRETTTNWYDTAGDIAASKQQVNKYYSLTKGFQSNKRARQNLLDKASMYLLSQVGLTDAKAFWKTLGQDDVRDYKNIGDLAIVTSIQNSTEPYITEPVRTALVTILNVTY